MKLSCAKALQQRFFSLYSEALNSAAMDKELVGLYFDMFIYYSAYIQKEEGQAFNQLNALIQVASNEFVHGIENWWIKKKELFKKDFVVLFAYFKKFLK